MPATGMARIAALTRATLADGIAEAALLMVYEGRFRDSDKLSERWMTHQRGKIMRALAEFEKALPDPANTDIVSIGLSCALGYLDWRKPVEWRDRYPRAGGLACRLRQKPTGLRAHPRAGNHVKDVQ